MGRPQQPELARSGKTDLDPDRIGTELEARKPVRSGGRTGPVPPENQPGHRPSDEQDKPDLDAFAAKLSGDDRPTESPQPAPEIRPTPAKRPAGTPGWPESAPAPEDPGPLGEPARAMPAYVGWALLPLRATRRGLEWIERSIGERFAPRAR